MPGLVPRGLCSHRENNFTCEICKKTAWQYQSPQSCPSHKLFQCSVVLLCPTHPAPGGHSACPSLSQFRLPFCFWFCDKTVQVITFVLPINVYVSLKTILHFIFIWHLAINAFYCMYGIWYYIWYVVPIRTSQWCTHQSRGMARKQNALTINSVICLPSLINRNRVTI